jgi:molybdopterin-guanine dinucleotide biosynthesis protein A
VSLAAAPVISSLALGVIAGGRGSRLGGVDKALLRIDGRRQIDRLLDAFAPLATEVLIARGSWPRPEGIAEEVRCLPDRLDAGGGPFAALHAIAADCSANWLLTLPIDLHGWPADLATALLGAAEDSPGAVLVDEVGMQPLIALWQLAALRRSLDAGLALHNLSVRGLVERAQLSVLHRPDWHLQNLNTPQDLDHACDSAENAVGNRGLRGRSAPKHRLP